LGPSAALLRQLEQPQQYLATSKLYEHIKGNESISTLQGAIDKFIEWANEWLVKINYSKETQTRVTPHT